MNGPQQRKLVREVARGLVLDAVAKITTGDASLRLVHYDLVEELTDEQYATLCCQIRDAAQQAAVTVKIPTASVKELT